MSSVQGSRLALDAVGVRGFLPTTIGPLNATFKSFYEDFIVRELAPETCVLEREQWPQDAEKKFIQFSLAKKNRTTMEAVDMIARCSRIDSKNFTYNGLKDRKGVTFQKVSLPSKLWPETDIRLHPHWDGCVELGSFREENKPCRLGGLHGNSFSVALRDVDLSSEEAAIDLEKRINETRRGVPNFFGIQRFGTGTESSSCIGKALLQGDYEAACRIISQSMLLDDDARAAARAYEEGNFAQAVRFTSVKRRTEHRIFKYLRDFPADYEGAIQTLPKSQRLLYARAYSSKVWNEVLQYRIKEHGLDVLPQDLRYATDKSQNISTPTGNGEVPKIELPEVVQGCEDIGSVVLPLPGYMVNYGPYRQFYAEVLSKDGWPSVESLTESALHPEFKLEGGYRSLLCPVKNLRGEIRHYHEEEQVILETEITPYKGGGGLFESEEREGKEREERGHKKLAYTLHFDLPRGTYASIVVREFLKRDV